MAELPAGGRALVEVAMRVALASLTAASLLWGVGFAAAGPCTTQIGNVSKLLASHDAGSGPTAGAATGSQAQTSAPSEHPPTAVMGAQVQDKAASPEDVRRQTQGQPTAAQAGNAGAPGSATAMNEAMASLERARALDAQGNEADCMAAVRQAEQLATARN
jgi:hypothetical protein